MIYNCFEQVAYLSQAMTLESGDVILTGTPGGVGIGFKPPRWLKAGDVVRIEIDRIGAIENRVAAEVVQAVSAAVAATSMVPRMPKSRLLPGLMTIANVAQVRLQFLLGLRACHFARVRSTISAFP